MKLSIVNTLLCVAFVATVEATNLRQRPNERLLKSVKQCRIDARAEAKTLARKEERIEIREANRANRIDARVKARAGVEGRDEAKIMARIEARNNELEIATDSEGKVGHRLTVGGLCLQAGGDEAGSYCHFMECSDSPRQVFDMVKGESNGMKICAVWTDGLCISAGVVGATLEEGGTEFKLLNEVENQFEIVFKPVEGTRMCLSAPHKPKACEPAIFEKIGKGRNSDSCLWTLGDV